MKNLENEIQNLQNKINAIDNEIQVRRDFITQLCRKIDFDQFNKRCNYCGCYENIHLDTCSFINSFKIISL
jgi:hypothetical protein